MKTAFLYAGQGSQHKGMGQDLYNEYQEFREIFDRADAGFDIKKTCFEDPDGILGETRYTQPCMLAFACGVTAILKNNGITPDMLAGLSLGEYSALQAAGVWDADEAIKIAAFRGEAMTRAAAGGDYAMTAIVGLSFEELQKCVDIAADEGIVSICNDNCPGQIVIGGEKRAVDRAADLAKENGAKRCIPLNVSGPFHTAFMKEAGDELSQYFEKTEFKEEQIPVVFNVTGTLRDQNDDVKNLLIRQVQSGVQMRKTLDHMLDSGVRRFVEIGPGKALTGFVKRCAKEKKISDIECISLETSKDIHDFLNNDR